MTRTRQFKPYVREGCGGRFRFMLLPVLFWVVLILSIIGTFAPPAWTYGRYIGGGASTVLFVIIGLRLFRVALQ